MSMPTPWKVNGNSVGVGALEGQNFKRKVWGLSETSRGVGGLNQKNLPWEGYGYFLKQHIDGRLELGNRANGKKISDIPFQTEKEEYLWRYSRTSIIRISRLSGLATLVPFFHEYL